MKFYKLEGLGNDFIFVNQLEKENLPWQDLAARLCDRHTGIGADGLVLLEKSDKADFFMRIYNSDGSEALMCGNASRCLGKFAYEHGLTNKTTIQMDTQSGVRTLTLHLEEGRVSEVTVDMGAPLLDTPAIPALMPLAWNPCVSRPLALPNGQTFAVTLVNMGNPHCVVFTEDVKNVPLAELGPLFENHAAFPKRINTEFVSVQPGGLHMVVWERGAGATAACGTGACATLVAAVLNGHVEKEAFVHMPGGSLFIQWDKKANRIYMRGAAKEVFAGEIFLPH